LQYSFVLFLHLWNARTLKLANFYVEILNKLHKDAFRISMCPKKCGVKFLQQALSQRDH